MTLSFLFHSVIIPLSKLKRFKMKQSNMLLVLTSMVLITTSSHAANNQDEVCVDSYNNMNTYVHKVIMNEKSDSKQIDLKIDFEHAMTYATETVIECLSVRPELSFKAQENFDEIMAIEEAVKYAKEYTNIETELEKIMAEV